VTKREQQEEGRITITVGPDVDLDREVIVDSQGRRVTEEYIERILERVLPVDTSKAQPIEPEAAVRRLTGRPSLTGKPAHSPRVSFRASPELRDRAARRAAREHKTVSALAREALERYLANAD